MRVDVELLKAMLRFHNVSQEQAGRAVGLSRDSFIRRLRTGRFLIGEIHRLMEAVPLTMKETEEIFFAKERQDAATSCP